jgi:peptidoglycan hydrolase CwlO-like protein
MRKLSASFALTFLVVVFITVFASLYFPTAYAATTATSTDALQQEIDVNNQEITALNTKIAQYQAELQQADTDKKTLQAAITALDLQREEVETKVAATQKQINTTQLQIKQLGTGIANTQGQITASQSALGEGLRNLQEADDLPLIIEIFSSSSLSQVWDDVDATLETESAIQDQVQTLQTQKNSLADSEVASQQKQNTLTSQEKSLASQQTSLTQTKQSKAQLLAETNAKESNYEQLLAQAKAQLASFSTFAENAGGSGLLTNQTSCDAWGCYYNQRDVAWGNDALNGTQYQLKSDGCLVTAIAMVLTHYGDSDVTPATINGNSNNFAAYYPAYLLFTIHVDGQTVTRITSTIDATLATGNPVIVGLNAYGGTHYVVLVSGSNGNYMMRDPYIPNGVNISFTAHYSLKDIFGVSKVQIS